MRAGWLGRGSLRNVPGLESGTPQVDGAPHQAQGDDPQESGPAYLPPHLLKIQNSINSLLCYCRNLVFIIRLKWLGTLRCYQFQQAV